jgi:hypothetical protein
VDSLNASAREFDAENAFYASCKPHRLGKLLAHYELFKRTLEVPGAIVECGVFKGSSFFRWAMLRSLFCDPWAKELIGFDTFQTYVAGGISRDDGLRGNVVKAAGEKCITVGELRTLLAAKHCERNVKLMAGMVEETVPEYCRANPELKISLFNLDLDFLSGSRTALEHLWPRVSRGGILVIDDYGTFEGATRAVDELGLKPSKFPYSYSPCYVVKA